MRVEFDIKTEHLRVIILFVVSVTLGWVLHGFSTKQLLGEVLVTNERLSAIIERQHVANQVCTAQVERQLIWLVGRHEGAEVSGWPTLEEE